MPALADAPLETLLHAIDGVRVALPATGEVLFFGARPGPALGRLPRGRLRCVQGFKPWADALERDGHAVQPEPEGLAPAPLVLVLPPRQRDHARATLARAVLAAAPGGVVLAAAANAEGARSLEDDLARLAGPVSSLSKHKGRAFWTARLQGAPDPALAAAWAALDAPRPLAGRAPGEAPLWSRPGLFADGRIDTGSALLIDALPPDLAGQAADLGAGVGVIAHALLARCPGITRVDLFEAERRALDLAARNLDGARVPVGLHWHDVSAGIPGRYDVIVSNPPFHVGAIARPALGRAFIAAAAGALAPRGRLVLVANRHLAYEQALGERFERVAVLRDAQGFKVLEATGVRR